MRPSLTIVTLVFATMVAACSQPVSPTGPTPSVSSSPALEVVATADTGSVANHLTAPAVPFRGTLEGRLTTSTPLDPPLLSNLIEGSGVATELGRFTIRIPHVVNTETRGATGTYEFTAANGDGLNAVFTGQATVVAPGVVSVLDTATITGGTGRFSNATGSFTVERLFVFATAETTATFDGAISAVGVNRR